MPPKRGSKSGKDSRTSSTKSPQNPSSSSSSNPNPSTSSSSNPNPPLDPLPLNLTESDCFILLCHMHQNNKDFDNSPKWWAKIAPFTPGKTVQDLRQFGNLFLKSYRKLAADRGWIQSNLRQKLDEIRSGGPSFEECGTLLRLVEEKPELLTSKRGRKVLSRQFKGKSAADMDRTINMVRLGVANMLNLHALKTLLRRGEAASTSVAAEDSAPRASAPPPDSL